MKLRDSLSRQYHRLVETAKFYKQESGLSGFVPRGHFYSPLPELSTPPPHNSDVELAGIDLNDVIQEETLLQLLELSSEFDWPETEQPDRRFYLDQGYFKWSDSLALFAMLRLFKPRHLIEVGSGFSSALMLDVNERFLKNQTHFTFVDPYPSRLLPVLKPADCERAKVITAPVQEVPIESLLELSENDILFIDSSHVAKFGSDVNYLYSEVLPRLKPGVLIHVHDIFWPFEYPTQWIKEGHAWNEAYLLRAFLCFNPSFEIFFWVPYAAHRWKELIADRAPRYFDNTGASIWLRRRK